MEISEMKANGWADFVDGGAAIPAHHYLWETVPSDMVRF